VEWSAVDDYEMYEFLVQCKNVLTLIEDFPRPDLPAVLLELLEDLRLC
jgi:hypothetical protein